MSQILQRKSCRLCNWGLIPIGSIGNHFINDFPSEWPHGGPSCPLNLVECRNRDCGLVQLEHTVDAETLYKGNYWYKSGINQVIVDDLKQIASAGTEMSGGKGLWIDIGANDGTLLKFVPDSYHKVGVEPAKNLQEELAKNCNEVFADTWERYKSPQKVNIITAVGMFYDSPNPNKFIRKVRESLTTDGVFIAQLMTLEPMLEKNDVGNLCHEHIEFYSYKSLKYLFERNGLEIFSVEKNDINGGSYRIFAQHFKDGSVDYEENYPDVKGFFGRIGNNKQKTVEFFSNLPSGTKVYGYGASTKGNTILQYYGLGPNHIKGVVDVNPEKVGKHMLTGIPIVNEAPDADYLFIMPWGFTDFFIQKERARGYKGKFIVSIPEFRVL